MAGFWPSALFAHHFSFLVIPAKAGIQRPCSLSPAGGGEGWGEGAAWRRSATYPQCDSSVLLRAKLSLACGERVTFFARAKKVTKESTVRRFDGVFAEATSLCLRRTAHFLCAVKDVAGAGLEAERDVAKCAGKKMPRKLRGNFRGGVENRSGEGPILVAYSGR